jgi:hypothetical protein
MPEPYTLDPVNELNAATQGSVLNAQLQQSITNQTSLYNNGDWRFRISLAPQSDYLYNASPAGILEPLKVTDGVIFPYTPQVSTSYKANYTPYQLTHSNYLGQFYQGSSVDQVDISGVFTAQDTFEANYLLAVIHFFRSVTKMFYGQDAERGSPPPLVYLTGFGPNQFIEHTAVVSNFAYQLPPDVDYIRSKVQNTGIDFSNQRPKQNSTLTNLSAASTRLQTAGLTSGAIPPNAFATQSPNLGASIPTYVPTKMTMNISVLPMQTRRQVSQSFSLKGFATGALLKGGMW